MSRLKLILVGAALLLAGLITVGVIHHARGARFDIRVSPRSALSVKKCKAEVRGFGGSLRTEAGCAGAAGKAWYRALVRNAGHRGAWVGQCFATGLDRAGHVIPGADVFEIPMWITSPGVGARPHLDPGQSATLDWFAPVGGPIDHYTASCSLIVYSNPPI